MSPSVFLIPARCRGMSKEALFLWRQIANARSRRFTTWDRYYVQRDCHVTVSEFLLHTPTCMYRVETTASRTSQPMTSADISRSELVISRVGFSTVTSRSLALTGYGTHQTIGSITHVPDTHVPPAPLLHASSVPLWSGSPNTSCLTSVGSFVAYRMSCLQSWSTSLTTGHLVQRKHVGFIAMSWLMGPNMALLARISMAPW